MAGPWPAPNPHSTTVVKSTTATHVADLEMSPPPLTFNVAVVHGCSREKGRESEREGESVRERKRERLTGGVDGGRIPPGSDGWVGGSAAGATRQTGRGQGRGGDGRRHPPRARATAGTAPCEGRNPRWRQGGSARGEEAALCEARPGSSSQSSSPAAAGGERGDPPPVARSRWTSAPGAAAGATGPAGGCSRPRVEEGARVEDRRGRSGEIDEMGGDRVVIPQVTS